MNKTHDVAPSYSSQAYLKYAQTKLAEEEARARLYLDSGPNFKSIETLMQTCVHVFVVSFMVSSITFVEIHGCFLNKKHDRSHLSPQYRFT